jgi:hypothetical protein
MLKAFLTASLQLLMVVIGTIAALLYVAFTVITHPRTAFKKTRRESESSP